MTCARRTAGAHEPAPSTSKGASRPDPRPGRSRARLSLFLPTVALLLGALSPFAAVAGGPAAPTFDPANTATVTDPSTNITLSFADAIKADAMATPTDFTDTTVKTILKLKKGTSNGDDIAFSATIDSDKDEITINPTADLDDGDVYVAISNNWYDADGNQGQAASATFTVDAPDPPTVPVGSVWSATLTVDADDQYFGCDDGAASQDNCSVGLDDNDFTYNGATYVVRTLFVNSSNGNLSIDFSKNGTDLGSTDIKNNLGSLTLNVDGTALAVGDAIESSGVIYWSYDPDPDWTDNQSVSLSLTVPAPVPVPAAPTGLSVTPGDGQLELGWTPPPGTLTFLDVDITSSTSVAADAAIGGNTDISAGWVNLSDAETTVTVPKGEIIGSLTNGTTYRVRVRFSNAAGAGAWAFGSGTPAATTTGNTDATLSDLTVVSTVSISFAETFASTTYAYTATVGAEVETLQVVPTANEPSVSTIKVNGTTVASGAPSGSISLDHGANTIRVEVTAQAGNSRNYTIVVTRAQPTLPAAPIGLGVTPGATQLALDWTAPPGLVASYDVHYTSSTSVANDADASGSNAANAWVDASHTGTTASHTITSLTNNTAYRVRVRAVNSAGNGAWAFGNGTPKATTTGSTDATLSALVLTNNFASRGVLSFTPAFSSTTYAYTISQPGGRDAVRVKPTVNQSNATVKVNGATVASTQESGAIDLAYGANTITIEVTAQAGNSRNYTITVTRALPVMSWQQAATPIAETSIANLVRLEPEFANDMSGTLSYAATGTHPASLTDDLGTGRSTTFTMSVGDTFPTPGFPSPDIIEDTLNEENETFTVTIEPGTGYVVGSPSVLTVTITDDDPPAAPGGLSLTAGSGSLAASWQKPDGPVAGYKLRHKTSAAPDADATTAGDPTTGWVTATLATTGLAHTITGLSNNTAYDVQVQATDGQPPPAGGGNGYGDWTASQSATPVAGGPGRVNDLDVTAGNNWLEMSWTAPTGTVTVTGYDVHYTSGPLPSVGEAGVSNSAPLSGGSDPADGWVDASHTGTMPDHMISGVTVTRWMRVRVRAVTTRGGETVPGSWTVATLQLGNFPDETVVAAGPEVTVSAGSGVTEGTAASFTLTADPAPSANLAVTVSIAQGGDVAPASALGRRTVTISSGATTASFTVATVDDSADEEDGVIWASIENGDGYTVGGADEARVTVADDDVGIPGILSSRAHATEGTDTEMIFTVSLSHKATTTVTVNYATADGSGSWAGTRPAAAGADYTATSGTLTISAGRTFGEIRVTILDDAIDEGSEYFLLRLSNPSGAYIESGNAETQGLIRNDDALQGMWLSRFGRTVATQVTDAVSDRLDAQLEPGTHATLAGRQLDFSNGGESLAEAVAAVALAFGPTGAPPLAGGGALAGAGPVAGTNPLAAGIPSTGGNPLAGGGSPAQGEPSAQVGAPALGAPMALSGPGAAWDQPAVGAATRSMTARDLLLGSSFHVAGERAGAGPALAVWGRMAQGRFDGEQADDNGTTRMDGAVSTALLGADADFGRVLAGLALGRSEGVGGFDNPSVDKGNTGGIESTLTTLSPYVRYRLTERVSAWGLAGVGAGEMHIRFDDESLDPVSADLGLRMGALGASGALLAQDGNRGMDLALKADAFFVTTDSEAAANTAATQADASRLRLVLQGGRTFTLAGGSLRPTFELGLRHDGGDAETGAGVELGGGLAYLHAATGLSIAANARKLVAHADAGYEEWGASATVRLDPGADSLGLSFALMPAIGVTTSAAERLWGAHDARALTPGVAGAFQAGRSLLAEAGYGFSVFGGRFIGTPNAGLAHAEGGVRELRIGWRLIPSAQSDSTLQFNIEAVRRESAAGESDQGVTLNGTMRF